MNELTKPIILQFVGHANLPEKLERKSNRFTISVERAEWNKMRQFPFPSAFEATVLDGKGCHPDGTIKQFVNPFVEFHETMSPTFMRVEI